MDDIVALYGYVITGRVEDGEFLLGIEAEASYDYSAFVRLDHDMARALAADLIAFAESASLSTETEAT